VERCPDEIIIYLIILAKPFSLLEEKEEHLYRIVYHRVESTNINV
jgi:hypothetical protein